MRREDVMLSSRMAGMVKRWHSWPTLTSQTVAEHCYNVLRIYTEIWGDVPSHISRYIIYHDSGEIKTGDLPFPVKSHNLELKQIIDHLENTHIKAMIGSSLPELTSEEKIKVKICDLLDMYEFGIHEFTLGNEYAVPIIRDTYDAAFEYARQLSTTMHVEAYLGLKGSENV